MGLWVVFLVQEDAELGWGKEAQGWCREKAGSPRK